MTGKQRNGKERDCMSGLRVSKPYRQESSLSTHWASRQRLSRRQRPGPQGSPDHIPENAVLAPMSALVVLQVMVRDHPIRVAPGLPDQKIRDFTVRT
jgi:hypothetical protein